MEPPVKRQRVGKSQDQLHEQRARNDLRLKSRFESIFEKFSKDFTGVGDEIDLKTGNVIVNNGHLITMQNEQDIEGLANEEDELGADLFKRPGETNIEKKKASAPIQEEAAGGTAPGGIVPLPAEVPCIGSNVAAALMMDDGSSYDKTVHGELLINRNILSQLAQLGPHIRRSIATVQRSAANSVIVSVETEDLTVDPKWRVPVLLQQNSDVGVRDAAQISQGIPESVKERSPSPEGPSLWAVEIPPPTYKRTCHLSRWSMEMDSTLRSLWVDGNLTIKQIEDKLPGQNCQSIKKRLTYLRLVKGNIGLPVKHKDENAATTELGLTSLENSNEIGDGSAAVSDQDIVLATPSNPVGKTVRAFPRMGSKRGSHRKTGERRTLEACQLSAETDIRQVEVAQTSSPRDAVEGTNITGSHNLHIEELKGRSTRSSKLSGSKGEKLSPCVENTVAGQPESRNGPSAGPPQKKPNTPIHPGHSTRRNHFINGKLISRSSALTAPRSVALESAELEPQSGLPILPRPVCFAQLDDEIGATPRKGMEPFKSQNGHQRTGNHLHINTASSTVQSTPVESILLSKTQNSVVLNGARTRVRRHKLDGSLKNILKNISDEHWFLNPTPLRGKTLNSFGRPTTLAPPTMAKTPLINTASPAQQTKHLKGRIRRSIRTFTPSSSPDPVIKKTEKLHNGTKASTQKRSLFNATAKPHAKTPTAKSRSLRPEAGTSVSLIFGEASDDELSLALTAQQVSGPAASPRSTSEARLCGSPGYDCKRSLCLTCC